MNAHYGISTGPHGSIVFGPLPDGLDDSYNLWAWDEQAGGYRGFDEFDEMVRFMQPIWDRRERPREVKERARLAKKREREARRIERQNNGGAFGLMMPWLCGVVVFLIMVLR